MKHEIEIHLHTVGTCEETLIKVPEDSTILDLIQAAKRAGLAVQNPVILMESDAAGLPEHARLHDCGIKHHHHLHCHPRVIHYTVDDEPQKTEHHKLTASEIMVKAEVDPKTHYLIRLKPDGGQESYKDKPDAVIHMHECMKFITAAIGPTPVS